MRPANGLNWLSQFVLYSLLLLLLLAIGTLVVTTVLNSAALRRESRIADKIDELAEQLSEHDSDVQETLEELLVEQQCCKYNVDVLVIGAGPAGAMITYGIWNNTNLTVLLLEAGADLEDPDESLPIEEYDLKIPALAGGAITRRPDAFSGIMAVNRIPGRPITHVIRARTLGGGGKVNGLQWVQPSELIVEEWEAATGNTGLWTFDAVQSLYNRMENYQGTTGDVRSTSGPQTVEQNDGTLLGDAFSAAVQAVTGLAPVEDYNAGGLNVGGIRWQLSTKNGHTERASPDIELLTDEVRSSPRVQILTRSTALNLLWNGMNVTGARFAGPGGECECVTAKYVALACNQANSEVLEREGIGNATRLEQLGINVRVDNPLIGQVHNHMGARIVASRPANLTGVMDPNQNYAGGAFLPRTWRPFDYNVREMQIIVYDLDATTWGAAVLFNTRNVTGKHHITNRNPVSFAMTDERAFVDTGPESDTAEMRNTLRQLAQIIDEMPPGVELLQPSPSVLADDDALNAFIRANSFQGYHETYEVAMGDALTAKLQVPTVGRLWVAGSSVIRSMDGNLHAPSQMTGLFVADRIGEEAAAA